MTRLGGCKGGWVMHFRILFAVTILTGASIYSVAAAAKVIDQGEIGFTVAHTAKVAATPADVWQILRMPQRLWSKEHRSEERRLGKESVSTCISRRVPY